MNVWIIFLFFTQKKNYIFVIGDMSICKPIKKDGIPSINNIKIKIKIKGCTTI